MKEIAFSQCWYWFLLAAAVCYLVGCFNFAVLISKFKKKDIRSIGSGNPGTMNMTRTFGLKVGGLNFLCDVLKGGLPAIVGWLIFKNYYFAGTNVFVSDFSRYFFGVFAILGHVFPITMKFRGGKGIASTMGLFVFALPCEEWWYFFVAVAVLIFVLLYIAVTEWGSMGSLIGVSGLTVIQAVIFVIRYQTQLSEFNLWVISTLMILLVINLLTWLRHSVNIYKLVAGEEHHTAVRKHKNKSK